MKLNGATAGRPIVRAHSDFYFQPDRDWKRREGLRWREMDIVRRGGRLEINSEQINDFLFFIFGHEDGTFGGEENGKFGGFGDGDLGRDVWKEGMEI